MASTDMTVHVVVSDLPAVKRVLTAAVAVVRALEGTAPLVVAELKDALLSLAQDVPTVEDPH